MIKWLEQNKKIVLLIVLFFMLILTVFYFFMIRPLAVQEKNLQQQLKRINDDFSFYQRALKKLTPQKATDNEKSLLIGSVPIKPNVEELIKDLERTELETGVVIEKISSSIHLNGLNDDGAAVQKTEKTQENNKPIQKQEQGWNNIFPKETLRKLKGRLSGLDDLTVSYLEMVINVNGEAKDVHKFVNRLENLTRIIHIQSYEYKLNKEKNNRLEAILTIRAFYCKDFAKLIDEGNNFQLDYEFDPLKLKRYADPYNPTGSQPAAGNGSIHNGTNNSSLVENLKAETGSLNARVNKSIAKETGQAEENQKLPIYNAPKTKDSVIKKGDPVFYVVQTGTYKSAHYLNIVVRKLIDAGVYPRIIGGNMSYIYTATNSAASSTEKIAEILKRKGFDSYVKTLPYRLTGEEKAVLLKESDDLIGSINEIILNGLTKNNTTITKKQLNIVIGKTKAYEKKVKQILNKTNSKSRKEELQETLSILNKVLDVLQKNEKGGKAESFWEAEGLILDYMLIFNGYVPTNVN